MGRRSGQQFPSWFTDTHKQQTILHGVTEDLPLAEISRSIGLNKERLHTWLSHHAPGVSPKQALPAIIEALRKGAQSVVLPTRIVREQGGEWKKNPVSRVLVAHLLSIEDGKGYQFGYRTVARAVTRIMHENGYPEFEMTHNMISGAVDREKGESTRAQSIRSLLAEDKSGGRENGDQARIDSLKETALKVAKEIADASSLHSQKNLQLGRRPKKSSDQKELEERAKRKEKQERVGLLREEKRTKLLNECLRLAQSNNYKEKAQRNLELIFSFLEKKGPVEGVPQTFIYYLPSSRKGSESATNLVDTAFVRFDSVGDSAKLIKATVGALMTAVNTLDNADSNLARALKASNVGQIEVQVGSADKYIPLAREALPTSI